VLLGDDLDGLLADDARRDVRRLDDLDGPQRAIGGTGAGQRGRERDGRLAGGPGVDRRHDREGRGDAERDGAGGVLRGGDRRDGAGGGDLPVRAGDLGDRGARGGEARDPDGGRLAGGGERQGGVGGGAPGGRAAEQADRGLPQ